jgi:hypothetical protein
VNYYLVASYLKKTFCFWIIIVGGNDFLFLRVYFLIAILIFYLIWNLFVLPALFWFQDLLRVFYDVFFIFILLKIV